MKKMYGRWQEKIIKKAMKTRRVLLLSGPRQCGKTTLAKKISGKGSTYLTLDHLATRQLAHMDPHGFVQHKQKQNMLIIDEVQRVPELLSAIKLVVDEDTKPGQYLLTGSANIQSLPGVQESLAGRIRKIRLRPFSQGELLGRDPTFLERAFRQEFSKIVSSSIDRKKLLQFSFRGGFPEAIELNDEERRLWHKDYLSALLEHDLQEISHITRHHAMKDLLLVLAAWSGKFIDITAMGSGLSISRPTLESYINALEALYLVERVPAWTRTDYSRVGKQDKLYMADAGLMTSILRWHFEQVEFDADRSGKLIETFMFNELSALVEAHEGQYELFQYRDREQHEIDFLIERNDQALLGIEIKAGSAIGHSDFKNLKWFRDNLAKDRPFIGIVLYTGDVAGTIGDHLWAIPFGALWEDSIH